MRTTLFRFFILAISSSAATPADLARVAILTYEDESQTKNFGYMPTSLTEAIDKSLQKKFEYVREDPKKSEAARAKLKRQGVLSAREAAEYCYKNDVQILVFGKFNYDSKSKELIVDTFISLGSESKFRALKERRNATDATIFTLADRVADDIVLEMTAIAKEQPDSGKASGDKLELAREVPVFWSFKEWAVFGALGLTNPQSDTLKTNYDTGGALDLSAKRILWRGLFAAARIGAFSVEEKANSDLKMNAVPAVGGLGYVFFLAADRWRIDVEVAGGYYGADVAINAIQSEKFSGATLRWVLGVHWLWRPNLSFGLELGGLNLFHETRERQQLTTLTVGIGYAF